MKALHVLDLSLPHISGYTTRARSIFEGQAAVGIQCEAVTSVRHPNPNHEDVETLYGAKYYRTRLAPSFELSKKAPVVRELAEMGALFHRLGHVIQMARPDVVHAHSPILCGIPAHLAAKRFRLPSVYEIRAFWEDAAVNQGRNAEGSPKYKAIRNAETQLVRSVDAVVAICNGIRNDLIQRGISAEKIFLVPNGVHTSRFVPLERNPVFASKFGFENKVVIAYIGTFFRFEGIHFLLHALKRIIDTNDNVRGLIVGHGETADEIHNLHRELGLNGKVILTGKVPPNEVEAHYAISDILCYPRESHRITELTTPLKPLEAMSMQRAVVVSNVGGNMELIRDGETALSFRAGDVDALVGCLNQLIDNADLRKRIADQARADMVENRDWKVLAKRYLSIYKYAQSHR